MSSSDRMDRDEENENLNDKENEAEAEAEAAYPEESKDKDSLIEVCEWRRLILLPENIFSSEQKNKLDLKNKLKDRIIKNKMFPFLSICIQDNIFSKDDQSFGDLKAENDKELSNLDSRIEDAGINLGESEVREAMMNKALYYYSIGNQQLAIDNFESTMSKTVGSSSQIDVIMYLLRIAFAFNDEKRILSFLNRAKSLVEAGGDWERKNLLRVYEALYLLQVRNFKSASKLLLDSIATFTCYQLCSYEEFVFYTVLTAIVTVDRVSLREKIITSPEILSVIENIPHLNQFVMSLYKENYSSFFQSLIEIVPQLCYNRYLSNHVSWFVREVRVVAYSQFLSSYRSVTLSSMAEAFSISKQLLDDELFRFVSSGRVKARIDAVAGRVETIRADSKNENYTELLKQGDSLLNRIQKLTKVITF